MGMSKEEKALYAKLTAAVDAQMKPESNPAQERLTNVALSDAESLKSGQLKFPYLDLSTSSETRRQLQKIINPSLGGTYGQQNVSGATKANQISGMAMNDQYARDAILNRQNSMFSMASDVNAKLQQASGAKYGNNQAVISGLNSAFQMAPKGFRWSSLLAPALSAGAGIFGALAGDSSQDGQSHVSATSTRPQTATPSDLDRNVSSPPSWRMVAL